LVVYVKPLFGIMVIIIMSLVILAGGWPVGYAFFGPILGRQDFAVRLEVGSYGLLVAGLFDIKLF
jgi:hypothetical protein